MLKKIDPHVLHSVKQAFEGLMGADNREFGALIENLGRELVYIRIGEGASIPEDFDKAVDQAAREVLEMYDVLEYSYRQRF